MAVGICPLSVAPIRGAATAKSEMVSQLLFGELFEVLDKKGKRWLKIRCQHDSLVGWVESSQVKPVTPSEYERYRDHYAFSLELTQPLVADDHFLPVTIGARLPLYDGIRLHLGEVGYTFSGQALRPGAVEADGELVLKIARRYLYAPQLAGGRSPFGIDSAGLAQVVFAMAGRALPRECERQVGEGEPVDFVEQSLAGDLAFFEDAFGRINHGGIVMPERYILHVYGCARIDRLDHFGIFNEQMQAYTHRLRLLKRMLPARKPLALTTAVPATPTILPELF
jgi:cell wall-associated NlpC family hydrolase